MSTNVVNPMFKKVDVTIFDDARESRVADVTFDIPSVASVRSHEGANCALLLGSGTLFVHDLGRVFVQPHIGSLGLSYSVTVRGA